MSSYIIHDIFRIVSGYDIAASANASTAQSTAAFGAQTRAVRLIVTASTGGVRFAVGPAAVVTSTGSGGTYIGPNAAYTVQVTPGEKLSVISNDTATPNINVSELTN